MINQINLWNIKSEKDFEKLALAIFNFQYENNKVYKKFCDLIKPKPYEINRISEIPFMPISFFKDFKITTSSNKIEKVFTSSGTSGSTTSKHHIADLQLYHTQLLESFKIFYGKFSNYEVLPLLPAYAEREDSSLIEMVDFWMENTNQKNKDYYLYNHAELMKRLEKLEKAKTKTILIGVSFALLDFVEKFQPKLEHTIVIETGGMKGRKKEITRDELHKILKNAFKIDNIQSEYGMTELLSQAYAQEKGVFKTPPWMKVMIRDPEDPLTYHKKGKTGGINIIDLTNLYSCSFIATDDLGRISENGFEIIGRFDQSDIRGCNLMSV